MSDVIARKNLIKLAESLFKQTHFTKREVEALLRIYVERNKGNYSSKFDRAKFRDVLHNTFNMTDDMIMDRVFKAFDKDNDSAISKEEWVLGLSIFLRGNLEERMKYCFEAFDLNADGYISREEMLHLLKNSLTKQQTEEDPDEGVKDLVEMTLKKMDRDHDSRLSYADYRTSVLEEPLLLEVFGSCLPDSNAANAFLATFAEKGKETGVTVSYVTGSGTLAENAAQPPAQSEAVAAAPKA